METGVNRVNCTGNVRGKTILAFKENSFLENGYRSDCRGKDGLGFMCVKSQD